MSARSEQILTEAMHLPPGERAEIAERLFSSLEFSDIDELWAIESEDRINAFESGEMAAVPSKMVFEKIEILKNK